MNIPRNISFTKPQLLKTAATIGVFLGITVSPATGITFFICVWIVATA